MLSTSHEDFYFSDTNGFFVWKRLLNDHISEFLVRWRESDKCGCRFWNSLLVLNMMVFFIDWSFGTWVVIGQTGNEVTHTLFGYNINVFIVKSYKMYRHKMIKK